MLILVVGGDGWGSVGMGDMGRIWAFVGECMGMVQGSAQLDVLKNAFSCD